MAGTVLSSSQELTGKQPILATDKLRRKEMKTLAKIIELENCAAKKRRDLDLS